MNRSGLIVFTAMLAGLMGAVSAPAQQQTQNISVVSGQGQLICAQLCISFNAMVVKVTDANGAPLPGVTVTWAFAQQNLYGAQFLAGPTTTTASDGTTSNYVAGFTPLPGSLFQQFFLEIVTASTATASVTFNLYEAANDVNAQGGSFPVYLLAANDALTGLFAGDTLTGQAGATSTNTLMVRVVGTGGTPLPGVSIQLVPVQSGCDQNNCTIQDPAAGPVVACATAAGAPANTVLTDANGYATCTPVFSGVPGTGQFIVVAGYGGGDPNPVVLLSTNTFLKSRPLNLKVTAAPAGLIKIISGDNSNVTAGQSVQLTAAVQTSAGAGVAGQTVNWKVAQGAATIANASTTTDVNGQTTDTVTVSSQASGQIKVTATLASDSTKSITFTINANPPVTVSGLSIVSGNNQSAIVGAAFGQALVVQVAQSNGQPASGVFVNFSVNGPATLSANGASTDSNGRAQVNVTAGSTAGAVTVTATASGFSQTFNLTVSPPGPTIDARSFVNAADFQIGSLSPCSLAAVIGTGLAPGIQGAVVPTTVGPWSYTVANDKITVGSSQAPIYAVSNINGQEQIVFQVPCDVQPGSAQITVNVGAGSRAVSVTIQPASPGVFQTTMSDGQSRAVLIRPDGSFVSLENPARRGENVVAFVTGLGATSPAVGTNQVAAPGTTTRVSGTIVPGISAGGADLVSAVLSPDLLGVYEVTFTIPANTTPGNNVGFSIGLVPPGSNTAYYSNLVRIPVQ